MVHEGGYFYRADKIEPIIFQAMAEYISQIQNQSDVFEGIKKKRKQEILQKEKEIVKKKQEMQSIEKKIAVLEEQIPLALLGEIALTVDELTALLRKQKASLAEMESFIQTKELELQNAEVSFSEWEEVKKNIPTWQEVFLNADTCSKRVLVNKLIDRIDITKEEMVVNFKINLEEFLPQPRMKCDSGVPESGV
jgi:chromosome segregation ATPase